MARAPGKVRQADVQRVLKGVIGSGIPFGRISVDSGTGIIDVFPGQAPEVGAVSAYDDWAKKQNAR